MSARPVQITNNWSPSVDLSIDSCAERASKRDASHHEMGF